MEESNDLSFYRGLNPCLCLTQHCGFIVTRWITRVVVFLGISEPNMQMFKEQKFPKTLHMLHTEIVLTTKSNIHKTTTFPQSTKIDNHENTFSKNINNIAVHDAYKKQNIHLNFCQNIEISITHISTCSRKT